MTYEPLYRGTQAALAEQHEQARLWFEEKLLEAVKASGASDEELREIGRGCPNAGQDGPGTRRVYRMGIDRTYSGGYHTGRGVEHADYFYVWKIAHSLKSDYGDTRIVLRKNGTLNMETLGNAAIGWARKRIHERRERDVLHQNQEAWEVYGWPGKDEDGVSVSLSKSAVGKAGVRYFRNGLSHRQTVPITRIMDLIGFLDMTAETLKEGFEFE